MLQLTGMLSALIVLTGSLALPVRATGISVDGTSFVVRQDGRSLRSADLLGAELDLGDGNVLRIDAVRPDPDDTSILLHRFSTRGQNSDWQNPCEIDHEGKQEGFPIPGRWDDQGRFHASDQHFALTCTGGAQAKCIRFGYKPWKTSKDGRSFHPLYEACVRTVRADYCGDGEATTVDGTMIDIYDRHGVQQSESGGDFRFEAGWSPDGAVCVNHTRIPKNLNLDELVRRCPRLVGAVGDRCDEEEARRRGAVLFNKSR